MTLRNMVDAVKPDIMVSNAFNAGAALHGLHEVLVAKRGQDGNYAVRLQHVDPVKFMELTVSDVQKMPNFPKDDDIFPFSYDVALATLRRFDNANRAKTGAKQHGGLHYSRLAIA